MARALIIDNKAEAAVRRVRQYAEKHPLSLNDMVEIAAARRPPIGDNPKHTCKLRIGFRCVFSIEPNRTQTMMMRHLSVSVSRQGRYPHIEAVRLLMEMFGFKHGPDSDKVLVNEEVMPGVDAINVIEPMMH